MGREKRSSQTHRLVVIRTEISGLWNIPDHQKVLGARRRGATTEAYGAIRRKHAPAEAGGGAIEGNAADDALMVDQGNWFPVDRTNSLCYRLTASIPTIPR